MDYDITYPCAPSSSGVNFQLSLQRMFDSHQSSYGSLSDQIPLVGVDYRGVAVDALHNRAFSHLYLPVGVDWIDDLLDKEGFSRAFKGNMRRMLDTGEYFAVVGVRDGNLFIDRFPRDWVQNYAFFEKTGELFMLIYIQPVVTLDNIHRISWKRVTWTPSTIKTELSVEENPDDNEAYETIGVQLNPYGFIPVVVFKLGTEMRGVPFWKPASDIIGMIQDIVNDIRLINAYHAAPIKYLKTDGEFHGIGEDGILQIGPDDDLGVLTYNIGEGLFKELDYAVGMFSDVTGIPVSSIMQVGRHASGEAIEARRDQMTRFAKSLREQVGQQMQLMIKMLCALISQGLVSVDESNPNIAELLTVQVVRSCYTGIQKLEAQAIYLKNLGTPVDLSQFTGIPDIKWVPIEKIKPQDFLQLVQGLQTSVEAGFVSQKEGRVILGLNVDSLIVAQDLLTSDEDESEAKRLGTKLSISPDSAEPRTDTVPSVGVTTLQ